MLGGLPGTRVAAREEGGSLRQVLCLIVATALVGVSTWLGTGSARAVAPPVSLASVLTIDGVAITPDVVRDRQPFTISARVANRGQEELRDLQWFPSVVIDPTRGDDHPGMEILARTPDHLDLAPGGEARISLTFRVTVVGARRYGLLVTLPDRGRGVVFASDPAPRATRPDSAAFRTRRALLVAIPIMGLLGALALGAVRSRRIRQALMAQLAPRLTRRDIAWLAEAMLALLAALNLPRIVGGIGASGIAPPDALGWARYAFIPLRWLLPPAIAVALARSGAPALLVAAVFGTAFAQVNAALLGQIPPAQFLHLWSPALLLTALCVTIRHARRARFAPTLAVIALLCYGAVALPWFRLYLNTVILHGGA